MKTKFLMMAALFGGMLLSSSAARAADDKTLPKGAVAIAPGTYTYTDADGKKWIFRQTPFGMAKFEDRDRPATDQEADQKRIAATTAVEDGEFIRFERPGPFGVYRWKQKKTELDAVEQAVWDRTRAQQSAGRGQSAGRDKE
jgi:hypothetical protein